MKIKEKREEKKEKKEAENSQNFKVIRRLEFPEIEIKKLDVSDLEDVEEFLVRVGGLELEKKELRKVLAEGLSGGAFVGRMLVGVGLGREILIDPESLRIVEEGGVPSLLMDVPRIRLGYEGKGIREALIKLRERLAKSRGLRYSVGVLEGEYSWMNPVEEIKLKGIKTDNLYLLLGYEIVVWEDEFLAIKVL